MKNSTAEAIRKLQKKASDLEVELEKKESAIDTHLNEKQTLEAALRKAEKQRQDIERQLQESERQLQESERHRQDAEQNQQELAAKNEALRLEMEEKDRIHQEKIDALIVQHMLDMRARFGRKTERFVDAESPQENLFPNLESEDPKTPKPPYINVEAKYCKHYS